MKYKALESFSGTISMARGDVRDIKDKSIIKDLVSAGYIEKYRQSEEDKDIEEKEITKDEGNEEDKKEEAEDEA